MFAEALSVSGVSKQIAQNSDLNNTISSSQLSKLLEKTSPRKQSSKSIVATGKSSYNYEQTTTKTTVSLLSLLDSDSGDTSGQKMPLQKAKKSRAPIDAPKSTEDRERKTKNTKTTGDNNNDKKTSKVNHQSKERNNKENSYGKSKREDQPKKMNKTMKAINNLDNEWSLVKQKQNTITNVSMQQLKTLDAKLISTYRQCQKRRLFFFGGMLYRSRDFVVRLYKDAKLERKTLETMAKQVETNRKKLMTDNDIHLAPLAMDANAKVFIDNDDSNRQETTNNNIIISGDNKSDSIVSDNKSKNKRHTSPGVTIKQESHVYSRTSISTVAIVKNVNPSEKLSSASIVAPKEALKSRAKPRNVYIVADPKLRRQLEHAQSLIDRIQNSSTELTSIVDDMIFVFRLDGYEKNATKNKGASSNQTTSGSNNKNKRNKSTTYKSPIKAFMERYGDIFRAPKRKNGSLRLTDDSNNRVSQQLIEKDSGKNKSADATLLFNLETRDATTTPLSNEYFTTTTTNNNSTSISLSSPLTLHPSYNIGPSTIDTGDSINITLDDDIGFGESSAIVALHEESHNINTMVYHLNMS